MLRPTRAGWIFFLLTFGVGFAALNTGNNLLYLVLSLMLSFTKRFLREYLPGTGRWYFWGLTFLLVTVVATTTIPPRDV